MAKFITSPGIPGGEYVIDDPDRYGYKKTEYRKELPHRPVNLDLVCNIEVSESHRDLTGGQVWYIIFWFSKRG